MTDDDWVSPELALAMNALGQEIEGGRAACRRMLESVRDGNLDDDVRAWLRAMAAEVLEADSTLNGRSERITKALGLGGRFSATDAALGALIDKMTSADGFSDVSTPTSKAHRTPSSEIVREARRRKVGGLPPEDDKVAADKISQLRRKRGA